MSASKIVISALLAAPTVTAVVSDRITIRPLPTRSTMPAITLYLVSEVEDYTVRGASGLARSRVSVECLAQTAVGADELGEIVKGALKDFRQASFQGFTDVAIMKEGTDAHDYEENQPVHRRIIDFTVIWRGA